MFISPLYKRIYDCFFHFVNWFRCFALCKTAATCFHVRSLD